MPRSPVAPWGGRLGISAPRCIPLSDRHGKRNPALLTFFLLAAATLVNFNNLSNMLIGTGWHVTLGLALACIYLCAVVRVPFSGCLGSPGLLILAVLASYLWIGASVAALEHGTAPLRDNIVILRVVLAGALVVAAALGATVALQRIGLERLLLVVLCLQVGACLAILATPVLVEHVYSLPLRFWHVEIHAEKRFLGTFVNPNDAGIAACQGAVTALAFLGSGRYVKSAGVALAIAVVAVVLTSSRTALAALAAIGVLAPLFFRSRRFHKVALLGVAVVGVIAAPALLLEHLGQIGGLGALFGGLPSDIRTEWLWPVTLSHIAESPLFGHGVTLDHAVAVTKQCTASSVCGPHNTYLMLWREAGAVPLTLLLLFVATMFCACAKASSAVARSVAAGWMVVFAVNALTSDNVLYSTSQAFILGLSCALICRTSNTQRKLH